MWRSREISLAERSILPRLERLTASTAHRPTAFFPPVRYHLAHEADRTIDKEYYERRWLFTIPTNEHKL
jgi:hypothetical protein